MTSLSFLSLLIAMLLVLTTGNSECDTDDDVCMVQTPDFEATTDMFKPRSIGLKFVAKEQGEGAGATVRRSLGSTKLRNLDPFLMLDEFNTGLPGGFPDHPHRGFETVTYVFPWSKGHMRHEDFLGNKGELRPGDLQWMTPGRGILHAEMPASEVPAHGLQLWINLPKDRKTMEPQYQEVGRDSVPRAKDESGKVQAIIFAGKAFGVEGPISTQAPVTYIHFQLEKDAELDHSVPEGHNVFVYTLRGSGKLSDQDVTSHEAVVLNGDGDGIRAVGGEEGLEFILVTGKPLNEPVVQYGPFVMSTEEDIHRTISDFQRAKNGFENARSWQSEIGNR